MSSKKIRRSKRKKSAVVPLIIVSSAVAFSALLAGIWQLNSPKIEVLSPLVLDPSITGQYSSVSSEAGSSSGQPTSSSIAPSSGTDASSTASSGAEGNASASSEIVSASARPSPQNQALPEQPRVTSTYFDDAVFIGDSLTVGIKHYDVMSNTTVLAATGISLENIFTKQAIKQDGQTLTILDALAQHPTKKVYIMLGANSLLSSFDYLIEQYERLVDEVLKRTGDDTIIYVQSVLPINEPLFHVKYAPNTTTNADIDRFNEMLCTMATEKGVYYLDVASVFKDANNAMPESNTPDGMHIISSQYIIWFDYLKTHALS
ncbi:GDSL-type esterase/lipase family protein [Oscillospiraceae bacterium LTW-04]|nr:GDSL-type esterase/lipase family protein [Oscillospiraceae bacterium MB24-C1]